MGTNFPKNKNHLSAEDVEKQQVAAKKILQSVDVTFGNMKEVFSDDAPLK